MRIHGLITTLAACLLVDPVGAQVTLRAGGGGGAGGGAAVEGEVIDVTLDGVRVERPGGGEVLVGWDRVRQVGGSSSGLAKTYDEIADQASRARTRLERDDWRAAEPVYESLLRTFAGRDGPTAGAIGEGLLRCRLRHGAQASGVIAWMEWLRVWRGERDAEWVGGVVDLPSIIDARTGLAPGLPPLWLEGPGLRALVSSPDWPVIEPERPLARELGELYRYAASVQAGSPMARPSIVSVDDGVRFLEAVVLAACGDAGDREGARATLLVTVESDGVRDTWREAWGRVAIGRSLLADADPVARRLGVVQMLHLPARFGQAHPYLAGLALAESAVALSALGDPSGASALAGELSRRYPLHPAHSWRPFIELSDGTAGEQRPVPEPSRQSGEKGAT